VDAVIGVFGFSSFNHIHILIMVSNIIGQQRNDLVLVVINRITILSFSFCSMMCLIINIFPQQFFALFGQTDQFITNGISVLRVVSFGLMIMSISNIWLNAVTGTGKTTVNLLIEIFAILFYMSYTWVFMKVNYLSLEIAWGNEIIYWIFIFLASFIFFKSGKWRNEIKS
jgi:Na+-driven multidrug efflux pump